MESIFEITIILSLIIAIATMLYAYRKKSEREDSLFGNCDSLVDKVAVFVFSAFYILPSLGITFILLAWWKVDYLLIVFLLIGGWIIFPLALVTIYASRKLCCFRHFATLGIMAFNIVFFLLFLALEYPQRRCNPDIMQSYYESHKVELDSLCNYTRSIVDRKNLQPRLDALGCFSVHVLSENKGAVEIGFRRVSMSAYYFIIFPDTMGNENYKHYQNDVRYIPYNHRVVFEYGSPAFGDIKFPGRDEYLKK